MNKKILTVIGALTVTSAAFADAPKGVYESEVTNAWFSVDVSALTVSSLSSAWTKPTNGDVDKSDNVLELDTGYGDPLKYTTTAATDTMFSFTNRVYVYAGETLPDADDISDAQAVLTLHTDDSINTWKTYDGSDFVALAGAPSVAEGWYDIIIDFNTNTKKVRYAIKLEEANEYSVLTYNNEQWLDNLVDSSSKATSIGISGDAKIDDFGGRSIKVGEVKIEVTGDDSTTVDVKVDNDWVKTASGGKVDPAADPTAAQEWLNDDGDNGYKNWESFAMDLTPSDETSKPILKSQQGSDADNVVLSLANGATGANIEAQGGVTVTYKVYEVSAPGDTPSGNPAGSATAGNAVEIAVPSSGVKYYKMKVELK